MEEEIAAAKKIVKIAIKNIAYSRKKYYLQKFMAL